MKENEIVMDKHILLCIEKQLGTFPNMINRLTYIKTNFCGLVCNDILQLTEKPLPRDTIVYICGDIGTNYQAIKHNNNITVFGVEGVSYNYNNGSPYKIISMGEVPLNMYNVGLYFREFFPTGQDHFKELVKSHEFQTLSESNKPGSSYRKGLYLSNVVQDDEVVKFNLLRCSTNLRGPTDNFRKVDHEIVDKVNHIAKHYYKQEVSMNHVLAQVYENKVVNNKQKKAKIKEHSDKTKDMPLNALMAFCTFYDNYQDGKFTEHAPKIKKSKEDPYGYDYGDTTALTTLRFRLKPIVNDDTLAKQFDIVLYPNSMFLMSLNTNRLYTHEIVPPRLPVDKIPTRLGYVIRCSSTPAVHKDGKTYIVRDDKVKELVKPTQKDLDELRSLYYKENFTIDFVNYDHIYYSMNDGDFEKPIV
jgi:hypothetical protein